MTEEQIREIIRDELKTLIAVDRFTFQKKVQIFDGRDIQLGKSNGTKIGTETSQKIGFYGTTPITQRNGAVQDAVSTAGAIAGPGNYGFTEAQANSIIILLNEMRASLVAIGLIKGSA